MGGLKADENQIRHSAGCFWLEELSIDLLQSPGASVTIELRFVIRWTVFVNFAPNANDPNRFTVEKIVRLIAGYRWKGVCRNWTAIVWLAAADGVKMSGKFRESALSSAEFLEETKLDTEGSAENEANVKQWKKHVDVGP